MSTEERWAIVEIMGHRVVCGRVTEITQFGVPMCRIDVPKHDGDGFQLTSDYGGASIFCITNTTREECIKRAPRPYTPTPFQLGAGDDDDEELVECVSCEATFAADELRVDAAGKPWCPECFDTHRPPMPETSAERSP